MIADLIQNGIRDVGIGIAGNHVLLRTEGSAIPPAIQADAHIFHRITDFADEEIGPQGAGEADTGAGAGFVENIVRALVIQHMPVEVHPKGQFVPQKPRFNEGNFVILKLGAQLHANPQFLAAPGEVGRMKQIEVGLGHLHITHQ